MTFIFDSGDTSDSAMTHLELRGQESNTVPDYFNTRSLPLKLKLGMTHQVVIEAESFEETAGHANLNEDQKDCYSPKDDVQYRYVVNVWL